MYSLMLPRRWPGRPRVRQALTYLKLISQWVPWFDWYASANKQRQKAKYDAFRAEYHYMAGVYDPDGNRIGR